jgi:hypothetical protein
LLTTTSRDSAANKKSIDMSNDAQNQKPPYTNTLTSVAVLVIGVVITGLTLFVPYIARAFH